MTDVHAIRQALGLTRAEFAKAMQCAPATVYRWEYSGEEPPGIYGELLGYVAQRVKDLSPEHVRQWAKELRTAPTLGLWLIAMALPPSPEVDAMAIVARAGAVAWLHEERRRMLKSKRGKRG